MNALDSLPAVRAHVKWLRAEAAAGRVWGHEAELAHYERLLREARARRMTALLERVSCLLCYALLLTLGWLLLTGDAIPLAITLVASFAASYAAETPKR